MNARQPESDIDLFGQNPLRRVVHLKREPCDVRIDRQTPWGNPFEMPADGDRATVIRLHRDWLATGTDAITTPKGTWNPTWVRQHLPQLRGKRLGCWCHPQACHGDTLAELANALPEDWATRSDNDRQAWIQRRLT